MTYKQYATKKAREIFNTIKNDPVALEYCTEEHWIMWDDTPCQSIKQDIKNGVVHIPDSDENVAFDVVIDEITEKLDKLIAKKVKKSA